MKKAIGWLVVIVVLSVALTVFYMAKDPAPPPALPPVAQAPQPQPPAEPEIRYPVPSEPQEKLPAVNDSDPVVKEALSGLWGASALELLRPDEFIRRVVATIDNLPREKVAFRLLPVKPAPGAFRISRSDEGLTVSPENAARYRVYVQFANAVDSAKLIAVYTHLYPLFQQAYEDLGYPKRYFNDRLVEVIDHLLAAPEMPPDLKLVQPKVFYRFADPELEARSAGHKIMMRIGNENAAALKTKLREIRAELTRSVPPQ